MRPVYVSFYSLGNGYEAEAAGLVETLDAFGLDHHVAGIPSLGNWQANTQAKANFIADCWQKFDRPIVWLDADARIKAYPELLDRLNCDAAAHIRGGHELLSGTVYFGNTAGAWRLIRAWIDHNEHSPDVWDQKNLAAALRGASGVRFVDLPAPYCLIFDTMRHLGPPVIEHMQASRRLRQ